MYTARNLSTNQQDGHALSCCCVLRIAYFNKKYVKCITSYRISVSFYRLGCISNLYFRHTFSYTLGQRADQAGIGQRVKMARNPSMLSHFIASLLIMAVGFKTVAPMPPIVIVPGIGGSQIEASLDRKQVLHWWCDKKYGWYTLWLNIEELLGPPFVECWTDDIKCVYNETTGMMENTPGVFTRIPGFGKTWSIEQLDPAISHPGQYFAPFVRALVEKFGYERGVNIRGAPYDFRYGPEYASKYFVKLKSLIESTYTSNKDKKVLLISQSMGCPYTLVFLHRQTQEWKDKYIASWMTISGVWGGAVKALRAYISGDPFGAPAILDNPILMRPAQRTYTSLSFIMPSADFWAANEVIVYTEMQNYTVKDYDLLFKNIGFSLGTKIRSKSLPIWTDTVPGVPLYCLHGSERMTPGELFYGPGEFPDSSPFVKHDDGDGTVNIRSLLGCLKWRGKSKYPITHKVYRGAEHNGILGDGRMLQDVFDIINVLTNAQSMLDNKTN